MILRGLAIGFSVLLFSSCSLVSKPNLLTARGPSSETDQSEVVRSYVERLLALDRRENKALYSLRNFPPVDEADVNGVEFRGISSRAAKELQAGGMQEVIGFIGSEESQEEATIRVNEVIRRTYESLSFEDRM
ncbi:MAG TPA: hypothetical protein PL182_11765, partial [Pseudobdellovibrionaceae bacterium]|nr:hypothetical protein [Pseudobdellovibrionaceae bacterium]